MSLIKGIHHVAFKCVDDAEFEKTNNFYGKVLGLPIARSWDGGIMYNTGAGIIEIFNGGEPTEKGGPIRHFAFATDDVDACVEAVKAAGYQVFVEPKDVTIPSQPGYPIRVAFCFGPMGEEIEFFQEI